MMLTTRFDSRPRPDDQFNPLLAAGMLGLAEGRKPLALNPAFGEDDDELAGGFDENGLEDFDPFTDGEEEDADDFDDLDEFDDEFDDYEDLDDDDDY